MQESFDHRMTHPVSVCGKGPAKKRQQDLLKRALSDQLKAAGADIDEERTVPDLARIGEDGKVTDAVMDVVATFPTVTRQVWRAPMLYRSSASALLYCPGLPAPPALIASACALLYCPGLLPRASPTTFIASVLSFLQLSP